ncbi:glycosyltransferase [Candidatus Albibeggiatoa sp. nov. NOAA]|uniref:glycosyltransferase n=1 Tax=Candidatus Albibeggiatoa sp. nov. NOAA TaxID=3162724 RepID=UPI0032FC1FE2|nr:glycosyltransferase [Thiotrichaceae bacterium]
MRILHVGKYYPPFAGGIENFLTDLIQAQVSQKLQVAALVHDHESHWRRFFSPVKAEIKTNPIIYRVPSYGRLLYAPISPQFLFWMNRTIKRYQPDILHFHLPNTSALWALMLPAARHIPWVLHWHSDVVSTIDNRVAIAYRAYRPFEQAMLKQAKAVIATSQPYLDSSLALKDWQQKTQVIPLGIATQRLPEPTADALDWAQQQWQPDLQRILHIGRLTYYKGQKVLIEALKDCPNSQLLIVGKGELQTELTQFIQQHGLHNRVKLLGFCDNAQLHALFSTCDVFCLPSLERTEAFGVVLMEAMRYAKPVIASQVEGSGMGWVVDDKKTGLLVEPNNVSNLVQKIQQLTDQAQCQQYGQAGYNKFIQQFDIQQVSNNVTALYQNLI